MREISQTEGTSFLIVTHNEHVKDYVDNSIQMIDLQWALLELARRQGLAPVAVGGNQLMYWNPHNGREHAFKALPGIRQLSG